MSLSIALFAILASAIAVSALGVLLSARIVRAAVWLLFTLLGVSMLYFLLGAEFLGAAQLIVYVGGTLVLVIFGIMLTAQGPFPSLKTRPMEWVVAGTLGVVLFALLVNAVRAIPEMQIGDGKLPGTGPLGMGFLGIAKLGTVSYLLPFEIVSVHLLVVLIGAAYLARGQTAALDGAIMNELGLTPFLILAAFLFVCGVVAIAVKRSAIGILMGVELVLNAANLNFVAFARFGNPLFRLEGQVFALMVIVLAAAEAAVALAIILNFYNNHSTVDVDRADELKG